MVVNPNSQSTTSDQDGEAGKHARILTRGLAILTQELLTNREALPFLQTWQSTEHAPSCPSAEGCAPCPGAEIHTRHPLLIALTNVFAEGALAGNVATS